MNISTKLLKAAAGSAGGAGLDVDEVFSTFLYTGQGGSTATINNGIDLLNEGGLVWIKARNATEDHVLFDTERGVTKFLESNKTSAEQTNSGTLTNFYDNGFKVDGNGTVGSSTDPYVSWTFRKAPKFFDVVTYTGNSTSGRQIAHNLGSVPGMIIVKRTDAGNYWAVWHRKLNGGTNSGQYWIRLDTSDTEATNSGMWNDTEPTATHFTVGGSGTTNTGTYVAYLFAHNDSGDGGFGPSGDQDAIKCGSFSTPSSGSATVDLGFEPQWLLVKSTNQSYSWEIYDVMRGLTVNGHQILTAQTSNAEGSNTTAGHVQPTSTGFSTSINYWGANNNFIYMAIRRGSLAAPDDATKVFANSKQSKNTTGFPVDMFIYKGVNGSDTHVYSRLTGGTKYQEANNGGAERTSSDYGFDDMEGTTLDGWGTNFIFWNWKRAPSYFDVSFYTGTGSATTVTHNLGVAPEMIWIKNRDATENWVVYHSGIDASSPQNFYLRLNQNSARINIDGGAGNRFNQTAPTASVFTVGTDGDVNGSGYSYIAYLFATVAGVSKVGSFTISGSDITVDCGFSSGARFVLIKRSSGTDDWYVFDTVRGYVSGSGDAALKLNSTAAESSLNMIDPHASGFSLRAAAWYNGDYIFYAIA